MAPWILSHSTFKLFELTVALAIGRNKRGASPKLSSSLQLTIVVPIVAAKSIDNIYLLYFIITYFYLLWTT
ncbi:Uncharacterised protein [Segatella copri]|nr:Uncharacterised protein [Segatella copri]